MLKGILGLADAPREWWLRLSRAIEENGWIRTLIEGAMQCLWLVNDAGEKVLEGIVVAYVDDLLFAGSMLGKVSLDAIGSELGFGSLEFHDFSRCGKRIRRASDGAIFLSMQEYHSNLQETVLEKHRKSDPSSLLNEHEAKRLRALLVSLQWLVAQLRFDVGYGVSTLQGEHPPTIATALCANALARELKSTHQFDLTVKPINYRTGGIVVVSDASLGSVKRNGSDQGEPITKVYSRLKVAILLCWVTLN